MLDCVTTPKAAYRLLRNRVARIDSHPDLDNAIVCPPGPECEQLKQEGVRVIEQEMSRGMATGHIIGEILRFYRLLRRHRPDIVHTHNSKAGGVVRIAAWIYRQLHGRPLAVAHQVHGFYFNQLAGLRRLLYEGIERALARISDVLLFQNRSELEYARRRMAAPTLYIGNGVDVRRFPFSPRRPSEHRPATIVCVARLEPVKNHAGLLQALGWLKREGDDFRALLIGETGAEKDERLYVASLLRMVSDLGLGGQVELCGALDHDRAIEHLCRADVVVLASHKEGLPRVLIEAMLCGTPCVATDVVGSNEVVQEGETGFLVPPGDARRFAHAIARLLHNRNLWLRMSQAAMSVARERFDEERVIGRLVALYRLMGTGR